ncbi:glycine-rich domain-containing protein [Pseudoduganella lutea]|uniref:Glycine-rich domain-containing protein n=1 Tax=Pseudoduganella lutea TaxID=321985 RepID=A0A4P6L7D2_9BURK|nr:hypothetical protein [Pseudoduganella lutea]QBE66832.1 hypothetical protein EWM63_30885 [Pseudoduganella lutea]
MSNSSKLARLFELFPNLHILKGITAPPITHVPVTSVNGKTGDVVIEGTSGAAAVTSVNGQTGAVTIPPPPVTSVNGQTGAVVIATGSSSSGGGLIATTVLNTAGSGTLPIPAGATKARIMAIGGGGGADGPTSTRNFVGQGGTGGTSIAWVFGLTSDTPAGYTVGAGGTAGPSGGAGGAGGASTVTIGGSTITANGGGKAVNSASQVIGGLGGTASGGDINITGTHGQPGPSSSSLSVMYANIHIYGGNSYGTGAPSQNSPTATTGIAGTRGLITIEWFS